MKSKSLFVFLGFLFASLFFVSNFLSPIVQASHPKPTILSPKEGENITTTRTPFYDWTNSGNSYNVSVFNSSGKIVGPGSTGAVTTTESGVGQVVDLPDGVYSLQVISCGTDCGDPSETDFTEPATRFFGINISAPTLSSPTGSNIDYESTAFSWSNTGVSFYLWQIQQDDGAGGWLTPIPEKIRTTNSLTLTPPDENLNDDTNHRWRAGSCITPNCVYVVWPSTYATFKTKAAAAGFPAPTVPNPGNSSIVTSPDPSALTWNDTGASWYRIDLRKSGGGSVGGTPVNSASESHTIVPGPLPVDTYFWEVASCQAGSDATTCNSPAWSKTWRFTVVPADPVIDISSIKVTPASPDTSDTVVFEAKASDADSDLRTISFTVESAPGSNTFNLVHECTFAPQASFTCTSAAQGPYPTAGTYKYRVIASDGTRSDTETQSFSVSVPGAPSVSVDHDPPAPSPGASVTYTANASDPDGIGDMDIFVSVNSGAFNALGGCTFTNPGPSTGRLECTVLGGYGNGDHIRYYARAVDNSGNSAQSDPPKTFDVLLPGAENCTDNVDNDGDLKTDCDDSDCSTNPVCTGGPTRISFPNPLGPGATFTELINNIINFLFTIAVIGAPILLVIAGVVFMTAAGEPSRIATARRMLLWTVIGFAIILISKGLVEVLKGILGI